MTESCSKEFQLENLFTSPDMYPYSLNLQKRTVTFIRLTQEAYRESSFLDNRIKRIDHVDYEVDLGALLDFCQAAHSPGNHIRHIFHSAFCCSTLIARCLDIPGVCFVLKEPFTLHQLGCWKRVAGKNSEEAIPILKMLTTLLSRRRISSETVLIKYSDGANNLIDDVLELQPSSTALLLYSNLRTFLISTLKSPGRRAWVRERAKIFRMDAEEFNRELHNIDPSHLDDPEIAAYVWLCQMYRYVKITKRYGASRVRTLDCQLFLDRPHQVLSSIAAHFHLGLSEDHIDDVVNGPTLKIYAKEPRIPFNKVVREMLANRVETTHAGEIKQALEWSASVCAEEPLPYPLNCNVL